MMIPKRTHISVKPPQPRSSGEALKVLAYHGIVDDVNFRRHVKFFKRHYNIIDLDRLFDFFENNQKLPPDPLLITFDDGDISLYEKALPILKEENIPATVFVITGLLNTRIPFWWNEIEYLLGKKEGNKKVWEVKEWRNNDRLEYISGLRKNIRKTPLTSRQLNTEEVLEMNNAGIRIANHSHTHPMFNQCTENEIEEEITKSTEVLDSLGLESRIFAYPNGNFSGSTEKILKRNQFKLAFLFDHKINELEIYPLRISRLVVDDVTPIWKLKLILSGWHSRLLPMLRRFSKILK